MRANSRAGCVGGLTAAVVATSMLALIGAPARAAGAEKTIAVIVPTLKITVLQVESNAAVEEAHKLGYKAFVLTHDFNTAKELQDAEQLITEKVAGVAWNVADENASAVAVEKVRNAGIPVVNMDRVLVEHSLADASYESDNFQCGALEAQAFLKLVGPKGTYAELPGLRSDAMARIRSAGAHSVLDKTGLKMVAQQAGGWDETKGFQFAGTILQAHPHILGFVAGDDSLGLGAAAAIRAQGRKGMVVVGIDGGKDAVAAIEGGTSAFKASAAQPVTAEGRSAVINLAKIVRDGRGAVTDGAVVDLPCTLIMKQ
ncbi:MAG: substrate-binding domain-containing protein [Acetobacteraceae bacterium]